MVNNYPKVAARKYTLRLLDSDQNSAHRGSIDAWVTINIKKDCTQISYKMTKSEHQQVGLFGNAFPLAAGN